MDDAQLLRAYATDRSEAAFRELVRRHGAMVHGVARRQPGIDAHLAHDITQRVFVALAGKAGALSSQTTLVGWLFTAARFEAARVVRAETRRRDRERKAGDMNDAENETPSDQLAWEKITPVLDAAMAELGEIDRQAVLLRFFSSNSFAEVGRVFQISEDAARKRVDRAVEKLRQTLGRRGIASTSAALSTALGAHAAPGLSEEMLAAITQGAWQQAATAPLVKVGLFMSSTKATAVTAAVAVLVAGALAIRDAATITFAIERNAAAASELAILGQRHTSLQRELADTQKQNTEVESRARAQAAVASQPTPAPASARSYLTDPAYRALAGDAFQARRHLEFQRFYRQRGLTPEQTARFEEIMVRQDQANLDAQIARDQGRDEQEIFRVSGPAWSSAMRDLLGDEGWAQLQVYLRSMALRNFVNTIAAVSYQSGEPISLEQADRIIAIALEKDLTYRSGKGTDPGKVDWNAVWEPAGQFLSPEQLVTFETAVEVWSLQRRVSLERKAATPGSR